MKKLIIASIFFALVFGSYKSIFAKNDLKTKNLSEQPLQVQFPISEGNFMIRSSIPDLRNIDLNSARNGNQAIMRGIGSTRGDVTWRVRISPPIFGISPGFYTFQNLEFGTFLESNYQLITADGNRVQGWQRLSSPTPRDHQEWFINAASVTVGGNQTFRISNAKDPNMCLDANTGQSGAPVLLRRNNGNNISANSQLFTFVRQ